MVPHGLRAPGGGAFIRLITAVEANGSLIVVVVVVKNKINKIIWSFSRF